jgi:anti-sigma regulatory factor (Ser/Thr protein kinase)
VTPDPCTYSAVVRLDVESRPESLTLVRSLLSAVGDALLLAPELLDDLRTAVSEACNNVVLHAYEHDPGPLTISLVALPAGLQVLVRDSGGGIRGVSASTDRMGVGLAVISALADRTELRSNSDGGTDVRMWFLYPDADPNAFTEIQNWAPAPVSLPGEIVVSLAPVSLLAPVLGRLTRAAAAQSRFTADGIAQTAAVTDAVAAYAAEVSVQSTVGFSLSATTRRLELSAGPFGVSDTVVNGNGGDGSWSLLAHRLDQPALEPYGDHKVLRTVIVDDRVSA